MLSPGNRMGELIRKLRTYERFGVEEYYLYDPDRNELTGWQRAGETLDEVEPMNGRISPRLGIRFDWTDDGLRLLRPDGRPPETYEEVDRRAEAETPRRAEAERRRADRLAEQLRALGVEPDAP